MTYIEFVDRCAIEDVCAVMTLPADRVILVGDNSKDLNRRCTEYGELMASKGQKIKFVPLVIPGDSLLVIVEKLTDAVIKETVQGGNDCIIDLTGGNDLYLTAAGIVYGKLCHDNKKINLVRFDIENRSVSDGDGDGLPVFPALPEISVEDSVFVYGGKVVYEKEKKGTTHKWTVDEKLINDVSDLWDICRKNPSEWNTQTSLLELTEDNSALRYRRGNITECDLDKLDALIEENRKKGSYSGRADSRSISADFLQKLVNAGLIKEYRITENSLKIVYRDDTARRCITKSGQVLEMAVYIAVSGITDKNGNKLYNDVMTGVTIDWDGEIVEKDGVDYSSIPWYMQKKKDTENEIDVMAMRGMVPIFISCKNGRVEMDELYKLETVAKRFGGKYGRKILVASNLDKRSRFTQDFLARAKEMDIKILHENVKSNSISQLNQRLRDMIESCFRKNNI